MDPLVSHVRFPLSGTFSANPITMTAGLVTMEAFDRPAVAHVNRLAERARAGIDEAIREAGVGACVTGGGSMFRIHLKPRPPRNYREAFVGPDESRLLRGLLDHLLDDGFIMINTGSAALSTAMGNEEIDDLVDAVRRWLGENRAGLT
jgi:glutamate-1-semialdehyde 2,1-aminomutase